MDNLKLTKEELSNLLTNIAGTAIDAKVKELGLDKIDRRFGNFPAHLIGKSQEDLEKMDKKAKVVEFVKALFRKDNATLASFKAMNEGTASAGGFIVPEEWAAEVNRIVEDFGLVPKLSRRYPMRYDTLRVPRLASAVTVSYPGEGAAGTPSQPVFEEVALLSKTLVGLTAMTNELLADANVDVVDLLTELFAEAIAGEADKQGLTGSGSPFTGILNASGTNVVIAPTGDDTFAEAASPDNLRDLISQVKPWALQGSAFIMHRTVWAIVQKKKASTGGDYFISAANPILTGIAGQGFPSAVAGTLWGYPVYLSDKMPSATAVSTKFIIFGNLKHLYWGVRDDMAINISEHATVGSDNLFEKNMSAVRVTTRHAIAVGLPGAFAVLQTSAT
ncbi:MAG TPA: phage major capsid protein [Candidatus Brocadiaceae bacterium]|nr:phage major capsid protein [Candidatus Brocadiaceae bacterium]